MTQCRCRYAMKSDPPVGGVPSSQGSNSNNSARSLAKWSGNPGCRGREKKKTRRDASSFADVCEVHARVQRCGGAKRSLSNNVQRARSKSLEANKSQRPPEWADRYLPSDLADGDFHSTASLLCTTGSLACKEGRSLFYGS